MTKTSRIFARNQNNCAVYLLYMAIEMNSKLGLNFENNFELSSNKEFLRGHISRATVYWTNSCTHAHKWLQRGDHDKTSHTYSIRRVGGASKG